MRIILDEACLTIHAHCHASPYFTRNIHILVLTSQEKSALFSFFKNLLVFKTNYLNSYTLLALLTSASAFLHVEYSMKLNAHSFEDRGIMIKSKRAIFTKETNICLLTMKIKWILVKCE